jgi:hypothetical protein
MKKCKIVCKIVLQVLIWLRFDERVTFWRTRLRFQNNREREKKFTSHIQKIILQSTSRVCIYIF